MDNTLWRRVGGILFWALSYFDSKPTRHKSNRCQKGCRRGWMPRLESYRQ